MRSLIPLLALCGTAIANVKWGGINISGCEWGCDKTGTCTLSGATCPVASLGTSHADGIGQMQHFYNNDNLNIFRLPVSWQYLVNNNLGGTLDATKWGNYDLLVQGCLATGATCVIDMHNYARWNNTIIGQSGGPTNAQFANIWSQLAKKYASDSNIIFALMNEPHDLPSITAWAVTLQAAVTAIRAICPSNIILLAGTDYSAAGSFVSNSASAIGGITNPDGSTTNLVIDIHQYLDADSTGTNATCTTTGITNLASLETWLGNNNRQALMTETGGGSDSSCYADLCAELSHLAHHSTLYLGWIGWAAGQFSTSYVLSETPFGSATSGWTDQGIVTNCVAGKYPSG